MKDLDHGSHKKHMFVCHETVSHNVPGMADILGVEVVLKKEGYGIHGLTDKDGHKCWAKKMGNAVFWHAGDVNDVAVGIENVSEIPIMIEQEADQPRAGAQPLAGAAQPAVGARHPDGLLAQRQPGCARAPAQQRQDRFAGRLLALGRQPALQSSRGHWDCWPYDKGGYFPLDHVIGLARHYATVYQF
jgi:hypothetical protein